MLLMEHISDIDHIIEELEQIGKTEFEDRLDMEPLQHSRVLANEVIVEFMQLLHNLEAKDFEHSGIIYDSEMIEEMCLSAYYMSRYNQEKLYGMGMTLEETCENAARLIGCNVEALLHMKKLYDEFFMNRQMGIEDNVHLTGDMIRTIEVCELMTEDEVAALSRRLNKR